MGFSIALSGLSATAKDLAVTGNNIANKNTMWFKESKVEFGDVYSTSVSGVGDELHLLSVRKITNLMWVTSLLN